MPRPGSYGEEDRGADGLGGSVRRSVRASVRHRASTSSANRSFASGGSYQDESKSTGSEQDAVNADLAQWENRLEEEVDEDLFDDPKKFHTIQRVIDVLGLQLIDDAASVVSGALAESDLDRNPAYRELKRQQHVVEEAIEHMALMYCADLNGSVIQVGQVSRRFNEAQSMVRSLRRQVRDIQDTIGATTNSNEAMRANARGSAAKEAAANAMSLRELWLKKLECESILSLLNKLDIIRAAPNRFDYLIQPPCRIGAAVLCLSQALATMFSDDVAQVQALHKIMEQLMLRKQRAEELIWDILQSVLFLRTANGSEKELDDAPKNEKASKIRDKAFHDLSTNHGVQNPFYSPKISLADEDDASVDSQDSGASLFSIENQEDEASTASSALTSLKGGAAARRKTMGSAVLMDGVTKQRMMIPIPFIEAELDLEADERRCLEQSAALYGVDVEKHLMRSSDPRHIQLPRYADPVLSLRILVECLANLRRLDDVERILNENLETEIRGIVQREQARTFARLERRRAGPNTRSSRQKKEDLGDFRRHWTGLLSAFGCVMLRLSHLAQILRYRIGADSQQFQSQSSITSTMHSVTVAAYDNMQKELKGFLTACIDDSAHEKMMDNAIANKGARGTRERGLFSLGIIDGDDGEGAKSTRLTTRKNVMEMSTLKFVATVLFPQTKTSPQVHHALIFRRSLDCWTTEMLAMKKELAAISGQDTSSATYNTPSTEESAIAFLDKTIESSLLPVLQQEAVDGTVVALEMNDAFDPLLDRTVFSRPSSNAPMDVEMCKACSVLYSSTGSLFVAIHRLPDGGEMYLPMVSVLEHVVLTFLSRVKAQVANICDGKTALRLLLDKGKGGMPSFSSILERRGTFAKLMRAYDSSSGPAESSQSAANESKEGGLMPLSPPANDTEAHYSNLEPGPATSADEMENPEASVEREETIFSQELVYLRPFFDFLLDSHRTGLTMCSDEELTKSACLAHSLLKVSSLLEKRLQVRSVGYTKTLSSTRALREAIKTLKMNGIKMSKFCRIDMLLQTITKLSKICKSSTLIARDAVRIPSSVNELGEYMTGSSDYLREAAGNAVTAYTFSCLEQYIPLCLMETVRVIASGEGIILKAPLTMNGIEALDRSGSVLYRDLKGATSFDNSFWDVELAAVSFERSASLIAMMELEMEELCAFYSSSPDEFGEEDFELMFSMAGPRRRGDLGRYRMLKKQLGR